MHLHQEIMPHYQDKIIRKLPIHHIRYIKNSMKIKDGI